jgi:hypothetical protein
MNHESPRKEIESRCSICSKWFKAKTRKARYCSNACRKLAYRKRKFSTAIPQNAQEELNILKMKLYDMENLYYAVRHENYKLKKEISTLNGKILSQMKIEN